MGVFMWYVYPGGLINKKGGSLNPPLNYVIEAYSHILRPASLGTVTGVAPLAQNTFAWLDATKRQPLLGFKVRQG